MTEINTTIRPVRLAVPVAKAIAAAFGSRYSSPVRKSILTLSPDIYCSSSAERSKSSMRKVLT